VQESGFKVSPDTISIIHHLLKGHNLEVAVQEVCRVWSDDWNDWDNNSW